MKMKIVFNNGAEIEVSQEIANMISDKIAEGSKQFISFSNNVDTILLINIEQVSFIKPL